MRTVTLFGIAVFLSVACNNNSTKPKPIAEIVEEVKFDSIAYYDSIYQPYKDSIENYFDKSFEWGHFNGVILFADGNHIISHKAYGFAHFKNKDSLSLYHTFQLASVSKPFTATAIMQLVEKGKISLTDFVEKYIEGFPYKGITIEMLLTHKSGLSRYDHFCDSPKYGWNYKDSTISNKDVINIINKYKLPVAHAPGRKHYYSNTNYILLAEIIEIASGMGYEEYMTQHIFTPANMYDTRIYKRNNYDELCTPTTGYASNKTPEIDIYLNGCVGDKGIYSNAMDLFHFHQALSNEILLSDSLMNEAFSPRVKAEVQDQKYGYGWRIIERETGNIVFHTGWWKGYKTFFIRIPEKNQVAIILSNIAKNGISIEQMCSMFPEEPIL
ncbi:MAG: serine hydrolase domain-containing protein [Bacteroidia bacterium]